MMTFAAIQVTERTVMLLCAAFISCFLHYFILAFLLLVAFFYQGEFECKKKAAIVKQHTCSSWSYVQLCSIHQQLSEIKLLVIETLSLATWGKLRKGYLANVFLKTQWQLRNTGTTYISSCAFLFQHPALFQLLSTVVLFWVYISTLPFFLGIHRVSIPERSRFSGQKSENAGSLTQHTELLSKKMWEGPCLLTA